MGLILSVIVLLFGYSVSCALQGGPVQPDYLQFEPADMKDLVSMQTGDFAYSLPLSEVPGPYGGYPLSIAYHAGISPQQEASWVGLGWSLNPGVINRDVRGVPDDQFHGGTLGFIYQYSSMSSWSVNTGWSMGFVSVGTTTTSHGGTGFSATLGPRLNGIAGVGFTVGTDGVGITAEVGGQYGGVSASLLFSTKDGTPTVGLGARLGQTVGPSAGVQYTPGRKTAYSVGFSAKTAGDTRVGVSLSSNGVSVRAGTMSLSSGKNGTAVSVGGISHSISNATGKGGDHTSTTGFAIIIPTYVGVFSFGFSQSLYEYWLRQATSEYVYGYMYQAGPAIVADGENLVSGMPESKAGYRKSSSSIPWKWSMMGRSLEYMGSKDLYPAYDIYSVSSEGISGTFRPYGAEEMFFNKKVSDKKIADNGSVQEYSFILQDSADGWQYGNEFSVTNSSTEKSEYPSYDYCISDDSCSLYALYKTRYLNEGNRMVYRKDKSGPDTVRSRMSFLFVGEGSGYYESQETGEGKGVSKNTLSSKLLKRTLNKYDYALYGSRKIEPLFEKDSPVGKLQGFVLTSANGSKYYFKQPVKSYLKADYSINREKGIPIFVDKKGDVNENFWGNLVEGVWEFSKWSVMNLTLYGSTKNVTDLLFKSGSLDEKCKTDNGRNDDLFYSYQVQMNPYATQWLLTEIQGADFVKLDSSIGGNVGYNVKFKYTDPIVYRWRTPYARPEMAFSELPNYRQPKNGLTPDNCDSRMYQASFGVKEYVYLESIETATHKVRFELNDPSSEQRADGKGWEIIQDSSKGIAGEIPILVQTHVAFDLDLNNGQGWVQDTVNYLFGEKAIWRYNVRFLPTAVYVNAALPQALITSLKSNGLEFTVSGFEIGVMDDFKTIDKSRIYGLSGGNGNLKLKIKKSEIGEIFVPTTGEESRYGLYKIIVESNQSTFINGFFANDDEQKPEYALTSTRLMGESGEIKQNLLLNWGDLIWKSDAVSDRQNSMRYLKAVSFYNKYDLSAPYRKFNFSYDYSLQPKTLNSYCFGKYPDSLTDVMGSPDSATVNVCASAETNNLYGKLTLKSIVETGCLNGQCASLPPFQFEYLSPSATTFRNSSKNDYIKLTQGFSFSDDDPEAQDNYDTDYYAQLTDLDVSAISTSDAHDEWGFWNQNATSENRKVTQEFADYGATAWSLNKVIDPAGGVLEIEYERDRFGNGVDYSNEKTYAEFVSFGKCYDYFGVEPDDYSVSSEFNDYLCLEVGQLYWREQCLGTRVAFWDTLKPVGFKGSGFEYLDEMGLTEPGKSLFYNLKTNLKTKVRCGLFGVGNCSRTRSVALLGDGEFITTYKMNSSDNAKEKRLLVLKKKWNTISSGIDRAGQKVADSKWTIQNGGSRMGFMWTHRLYEEMKGGDLRTKRLTRHDIGTKQQTEYIYSQGELAQLPDSAFNVVLGSRFYASKLTYSMPEMNLVPISRIVGISDNDLFFVPGSRVTYPEVTVHNTDDEGVQLNGRTEFKYITPETGVPKAYVDSATAAKLIPFLKINTRLFRLGSVDYDLDRGILVKISLLDSNKNLVSAERNILLYEPIINETWFYSNDISKVKYIHLSTTGLLNDNVVERTLAVSKQLNDFNEISLSFTINITNLDEIAFSEIWLRSQKNGFYPILYKDIDYSYMSVLLPQVQGGYYSSDSGYRDTTYLIKQIDSAYMENSITYHDLTAFLGLNYAIKFFRGNNSNEIPIKIDSNVYSTMVPDVLDDVATGVSTDVVREKMGRQVERWSYQRKLDCVSDNAGKKDRCKDDYRYLYEQKTKRTKKEFKHVRYPVYQVASLSFNGYDNQEEGGSPVLMTSTSIENHHYDPLTGSPSLTLARSNLGDGKEMRKLTQIIPHYLANGDTGLSNEMYSRNMLTQKYLDKVFTGTLDKTEPWNSLLINNDSLQKASISPYRFLSQSVVDGDRQPILSWGTYSIKDKGASYTDSELYRYQNASLIQPSLMRYNGTHIRKVDKYFKVRETQDMWGRVLTTHYSSDGLYQTGLFFPALLTETAQLIPYQEDFVSENCVLQGSFEISLIQNGVVALNPVSIVCSPTSNQPLVAEYRWKHEGKWSNERDLLVSGADFSLMLSSEDALGYLRVYPANAEAKTFLYDSWGNLVQIVAENNTSTYYEYDSFGKLVQARDDDGISFKTHHREFMNDTLDDIPVNH